METVMYNIMYDTSGNVNCLPAIQSPLGKPLHHGPTKGGEAARPILARCVKKREVRPYASLRLGGLA